MAAAQVVHFTPMSSSEQESDGSATSQSSSKPTLQERITLPSSDEQPAESLAEQLAARAPLDMVAALSNISDDPASSQETCPPDDHDRERDQSDYPDPPSSEGGTDND
ncbi:hypothetical protein BJ508DRAFT_333549 [Ascobolus immersus RN42]|uniref:Uncharacterized protein n=1 Tax=Ascobolus immersus RN42 TaxID=1160509 RepID=A0A3N4HJ78_ASCIM|nr:hypothetical protein BJ508DRAFT_333549 [Ascobolus immersus RN42]